MPYYVVETPIRDANGLQRAVMRVWVATEARARELAAHSGGERTWREVALDEMPAQARENTTGTAIE